MSDLAPEPENHAGVWLTKPSVDLAKLDDKRLADCRHPSEWQALTAIAVGFVVLLIVIALVHPSVTQLLHWLPSPLERAIVDALHPARLGPIIVLIFCAVAALDAIGLVMQHYDLPYDSVEITSVTFPQFGPVVQELSRRFEMPRTLVFASRTAPLVGNAFGIREPYLIVFSSGMLGSITVDEFRFLLGRQLGHVKLGHTRLALFFGSGQIPLSLAWLQKLRQLVFGNYQRAQELSADRIGLLATRDLRPAVSLLAKLQIGVVRGAKIDLESLAPRASELQGGRHARVVRLRQLLTAQPRFVFRLLELTQWAGLPHPPPADAAPASDTPAAASVAPAGPDPATSVPTASGSPAVPAGAPGTAGAESTPAGATPPTAAPAGPQDGAPAAPHNAAGDARPSASNS